MNEQIWNKGEDPLLKTIASFSGKTIRFFPKSGNLGDGFITYATLQLFKHFGVNFTTHTQDERFDNEIIIIGGGGNLVEGKYEDVATLIWEHRKTNNVYLFPHTIVGYDDILKETFSNLTVFCRDPISYDHCIKSGANPDRVSLVHDVTFYLSDDHFNQSGRKGAGTLNAFRQDGESVGNSPPVGNIDVSLAWNGDIWQAVPFVESATASLADFLAQYDEINTDRLHITILSAFLGRKVNMFPNNYFKNEAIFQHSIAKRFPNVSFASQIDTERHEKFYPVAVPLTGDALIWKRRFEREQDLHREAKRELKLVADMEASRVSENTRMTQSLANAESTIEALLNSTSWKVTSPLRKIRTALKRKSGRNRNA